MYKWLIIGVTCLILGYAGYYFNTSGGSDLLTKAATQAIESQEGVSLAQLFSGIYICDNDSGCQYPVTLTLIDDTTFELFYTSTDESFSQYPIAQGTWGVGKGNALILITDRRVTLPEVPNTVHAKIDTIKIREFSKKKPLYSWMNSPVFTRSSNGSFSQEHSLQETNQVTTTGGESPGETIEP